MKAKHLALLVAMSAMTVYNFAAPDAASFRSPELARIVFWHLPCAFLSIWFAAHIAYLGFRYLRSRDLAWDGRLGAAVDFGLLYGTLTMVTGIIFSKAQWGNWWKGDPRQTSYLMVLFLFALGVALRSGFTDERRRAAVSSAYSLITVLPSMFLILVFPRLEMIREASLHPSTTIQQGEFDTNYWIGVLGTFIVLAFLSAELYSMRVRASLLALKMEEDNGMDKIGRGDSTPTGVVRPVAVPEEH